MAEFEWELELLDKIKVRARFKGISKRHAFRLGLAVIVLAAVIMLSVAGMIILR